MGYGPWGGEITPRDVLYKKPRLAKLPLRRASQEGCATGARLAEFGVTGASSSPCTFPHCSDPSINIPILKEHHFEEHQFISLPRGLTSLSVALSVRKKRIFPTPPSSFICLLARFQRQDKAGPLEIHHLETGGLAASAELMVQVQRLALPCTNLSCPLSAPMTGPGKLEGRGVGPDQATRKRAIGTNKCMRKFNLLWDQIRPLKRAIGTNKHMRKFNLLALEER